MARSYYSDDPDDGPELPDPFAEAFEAYLRDQEAEIGAHTCGGDSHECYACSAQAAAEDYGRN